MIDLLELKIDFSDCVVESVDDNHCLVGVDLFELDIPMGSRTVYLNDEEEIRAGDLYHPYESLPTSFTGMALKVNFDGNFFPHVLIKGSPAKILQGHNVFGTDNLLTCTEEMIYWLQQSYPSLYSLLSINTAQVRRIDVTYMSHVDSPKKVRHCIDFLSRISSGQTKPTKNKKYETTVYWGGATSRLIRQKCYSKFDEFMAQLDDYKKKAKRGDSHALKIVQAMSDERLLTLARNSLRWECTLLFRWLERNDIPTNIWEMIRYQATNPNFLQDAWQKGFNQIFNAIKGQDMKIVNDDQVLARLKKEFAKPLKSGKWSYRKAINLFSFYTQLKSMGYYEIKAQNLYSRSRFHALVSDLISVGFSKAYLQNLNPKSNTKTIPFVQMISVDFSQQTPDWYQEPISTPQKLKLANVA